MTKYQLTIVFDSADLDSIVKGQYKVTLRKSTTDQDPANVIWLAFDPLPQSIVQWDTSYGLYASTSKLTPGDIITKNASVDAAYPNRSYVLGPAFTFSAPSRTRTCQLVLTRSRTITRRVSSSG